MFLMNTIITNTKKFIPGIIVCTLIAAFSFFAGSKFPIIGGPVFAIILGMLLHKFTRAESLKAGIGFSSKKVLHWAVILLGFGLNLNIVLKTGLQSLPIIISTIATSLIIAFVLQKLLKTPVDIATLVGVGSSICGGSAIAATAPVIKAKDEDVAQAISIIFFFNVLAALVFPALGGILGFSTDNGEAFGIFAGTAVNDTSSVTACASTWDTLYRLGSQTLDKAVTVKLTRTLAIIPITVILGLMQAKKASSKNEKGKISIKKILPMFIIYFILASVITTIASHFGLADEFFAPAKTLSKFFIIIAMAAIGLNTDIVKLIKTGGKPLFIGFSCWIGISLVSLGMQSILGLW